jgi:NAD-dependent DNA ligase
MKALHRIFNRAQIDDRQVNELIGLAHGLTADGKIDQSEAECLHKWLVANTASHTNPIVANLLQRVSAMLRDGLLDAEESKELFETLSSFAGGNYEIGELQKSTSLPLDRPCPEIRFAGARYCFTGTFAFGSRAACEEAVKQRGALSGSLTRGTQYLVIGIYATDSWAHSSYGRKIEKAVAMKAEGVPIKIIGEAHWVEALA